MQHAAGDAGPSRHLHSKAGSCTRPGKHLWQLCRAVLVRQGQPKLVVDDVEIVMFSGRQKALHGKVEALEARLRQLEKAGTDKDG